MLFGVMEGMDVGVRSSNNIYDPIGQVGWQHWVSRKVVDERWSPYFQMIHGSKVLHLISYSVALQSLKDLGRLT
jgi:hypothetical protein